MVVGFNGIIQEPTYVCVIHIKLTDSYGRLPLHMDPCPPGNFYESWSSWHAAPPPPAASSCCWYWPAASCFPRPPAPRRSSPTASTSGSTQIMVSEFHSKFLRMSIIFFVQHQRMRGRKLRACRKKEGSSAHGWKDQCVQGLSNIFS
jgi:hypothetical protein